MDFNSLLYGEDPEKQAMTNAPIPPVQNMSQAPMVSAMTRPQDAHPMDEGIAIKGWNPHKRTTLGTIADIALALIGAPIAPFKHHVDQQNMQEAMEGFTSDPLGTIQKIARLKGHEGDALKLYEQYTDNQRQQGTLDRQNRALDMRDDDYIYNLTANMMGAANEKNWGKMREIAIKRAQSRGMDPNEISSIIPENFDPDSVDFIRYGAVKTKDQMQMQETKDHHIATETETATHHGATEAQQATNESGRNSRQASTQAAINARQQNSLKAHPGKGAAQGIMTKYGPAIIDETGKKMVVVNNDPKDPNHGKRFGYIKVNDKWVPVGEVKAKK